MTARLFASKPWRSACCLIGTALIGILFPLFSEPRSQVVEVLDPLLVPVAGDPAQAVVTVSLPEQAPAINCDLVVAGGSLGGVAAALQAARAGLQVCMTESTRWLGGQITAEGVSALDENQWVETTGATGSYQQLRNTIRSYYRSIALSRNSPADFNPGACWVSALCFEPAVALKALQQMIGPFEASHKLLVLLRTVPVQVLKTETKITSILAYKFESKGFVRLNGKVFIDATELGDLLPIAGAQFRVGADSREDTGEPDAASSADPAALQSFNFPFVLSSDRSHSLSTSKPLTYDALSRNFGLSVGNDRGELTRFGFYRANPGTAGSFWTYRRLIDHTLFPSSLYPADLSMINWDSNDVCDSNYLSLDPLAQAKAFQHGKQTSIAFAWWLQHEAPADDGAGKGYPQLTLRNDVLGSSDGLSQVPYIREARRMKALKTIKEQDVAEPWQAGVRAAFFADTVGIGYYPIDIHSCGASQKLPKSKPYQISGASLISRNVPNLLAGGKNIGTTHIVNGGYRLQPTEWAIGEASAVIAVKAIRLGEDAAAVLANPGTLSDLQLRLLQLKHPLIWFDDVELSDPDFAAIQWAALAKLVPLDSNSLHFRPKDLVLDEERRDWTNRLRKRIGNVPPLAQGSRQITRAELARWLAKEAIR